MTAIFGLIRTDGAPATAAALSAMGEAIAYWGPDGGTTWRQDVAGLGQRLSHNTPEAIYETGPIVCRDGTVVVAAARLDNRDELIDTLAIETDRSMTTDSQIVAVGYQKWGDALPTHLFGDWAFAAWHPRTRRLLLARDHFGNTGLYYYRDARSFAFASSRKALFALSHVPRKLNEERLAQLIVAWLPDGGPTVHTDIFRLPPAHRLTVTPEGVDVKRYWRLEDVADVRLGSDQAYVEQFLELYRAAVRARLRSRRPIATTLSSGLDSGSIAALAARELEPRGEALTAFTSVPLFEEIAAILPRVQTNEWRLAHAAAGCYENIDHYAVRAEHLTPLAAIERSLNLHDEPILVARHLHWTHALLEQCRDHGCGTLLIGHSGNGAGSWSGDQQRAVRSFLTGHWVDAWGGLRTAKQSARSWPGMTRVQLLSPLVGMARGYAFRSGWLPNAQESKYRIINPEFARRLRLAAKMRANDYGPSFAKIVDIRAARMRILDPEANPSGAFWNEMGAGCQLDVRDPTGDVRLLEFCIGLPIEQFVGPHGDRWLIRRAVEGLLPPEIQWNTRIGRQGADLPLRLRADGSNVDSAIAEIDASQMAREYLDIPLLHRRWASLQTELGPRSYEDASTVTRTLLVGRFLMRLC